MPKLAALCCSWQRCCSMSFATDFAQSSIHLCSRHKRAYILQWTDSSSRAVELRRLVQVMSTLSTYAVRVPTRNR